MTELQERLQAQIAAHEIGDCAECRSAPLGCADVKLLRDCLAALSRSQPAHDERCEAEQPALPVTGFTACGCADRAALSRSPPAQEPLRDALCKAGEMLSAVCGWQEDDWQGVKYHASQTLQEINATLAADRAALSRSQPAQTLPQLQELENWKASALSSLNRWHAVGDALRAYYPLPLGVDMPTALLAAIQQLPPQVSPQVAPDVRATTLAMGDAQAMVTMCDCGHSVAEHGDHAKRCLRRGCGCRRSRAALSRSPVEPLLMELRELEDNLEANAMDSNRTAWGADIVRRAIAILDVTPPAVRSGSEEKDKT